MNDTDIERLVMARLLAFPNLDKARVKRENLNFIVPATGIWIAVYFLGGLNDVADINGEVEVRQNGHVQIQVLNRENTGTGEAKKFADDLANHFKTYQTDKLELLIPSVVNMGMNGELACHQYNVIIPYRYN